MHDFFQPFAGLQLYIELVDADGASATNHELIDRFAIDVTSPIGSTSGRQTYSGVFGLAEIDLTIELECAVNFYGPNCDTYCLENCDIDHCAGVTCGQNQRCVDVILNYTCVCEPGYTGPDCSTEFDVCMGVNCTFGSCVEGVGSCMCDPGYTGQFCEARLDSYELQVTINSFNNPGGMCASSTCGPELCCDGDCPSSCHYYFSLCQRTAGTPVSTLRATYQGYCEVSDTIVSHSISDGSTFADRVFGTPNPIIFTGALWVSSHCVHYLHGSNICSGATACDVKSQP